MNKCLLFTNNSAYASEMSGFTEDPHLATHGIQNFRVLSVKPELDLVSVVKYFMFLAGFFFSLNMWSYLIDSNPHLSTLC